ncbi:phospholipase D-like domain-containing protein DpdK [Dyella japonica]|uniref:Phosphatidylserine/phosphatidylglycerophosphate/ cardiolipin synthase-like enzyme n=1 Tax=Dyella japonica TaxID=231455 RepID=A0ABV2JZB1_9GAMM
MSLSRKIFKSSTALQGAVHEVLVFAFTQELLSPSQHVFLVAPWISNIVVFDNRLGQFSALNPDWSKREIRLVEVLATAAANGSHIHVLTRPDAHNQYVERRLKEAMADAGLSDALNWKVRPLLHSKGLLTDRFYLDGSMNLTESGVHLNDETIAISYEQSDIAQARVHFEDYL